MPGNRRLTQEAHERFVVTEFLAELRRRHRSDYRVVQEPNPPEAIIRTRGVTRWVEVTAAIWNDQYAQDLYSYATTGEVHKPMRDGAFMNMTPQFAKRFVAIVKQKLEKASYGPFRDAYGPGYLVVSVHFPFFGRDAFQFIEKFWSEVVVADRGYFRSVYVYHPVFGSYKFTRWPHARVGT